MLKSPAQALGRSLFHTLSRPELCCFSFKSTWIMAAAGDAALSRFRQRLSSHNLRLNIEEANRIAQLDARNKCRFVSPESFAFDNASECAEEIKVEGKELFTNFVKEEICRSELEEKAQVVSPWVVE